MVQSDPKVILLQKPLGECPSKPIPLWTSLHWDDSPLISLTWLGDGKGRAVWSLIGKTNSTPLERFLARTKGETRLISHLSTVSIFPRLEDNSGFKGTNWRVCTSNRGAQVLGAALKWFWGQSGEWRASRSTHFVSVLLLPGESGSSLLKHRQTQVWWSMNLDCAGRFTSYRHKLKDYSQAQDSPENSVWPISGFHIREIEPYQTRNPAAANPLTDRGQQWDLGKDEASQELSQRLVAQWCCTCD